MTTMPVYRAAAAASFALLTAAAMSGPAKAADAEQVVDALNAIFGKQGANMRASHAKGQCVKGTFTPATEAKALTKSASFAAPLPVVGRFSMGGGNPKIPDGTKAAVRGFAFKIDPDGKATTQFVMANAPVQFARNLDQMLGFLKARAPGADGKPDPEKIKAFAEANPDTKRQGAYLASKPVPASYAGVNYWGIHAYTVTNAEGADKIVKFKLVPVAGEAGLTDDEAKAKPADFLVAELTERLAKGPASFDLVAIPGEAGDATNDPSSMWKDEETRKTVKLGTLALTALEDSKVCDGGIFDPTILADGIAGPKDDDLFAVRSPSYAISATRRVN
jgi:catalase